MNKFVEVKDNFARLKFKLNEKLKKCEALIEERNKYKDATDGKKILAKKKAEVKAEQYFEDIKLDIKEMEKELKHQKKDKKKFKDTETKSKILDLLKKKLNILKTKLEDNDYDPDEYSYNENQIQTLENFLSSKQMKNEDINEREIYEEEENKIDEWKNRVKVQDDQLDEIHKNVGKLKLEAKRTQGGINTIGKKVKKLDKHTGRTFKAVDSQNERLKQLLNKFRSGNKYCCDIILILILIGLICTLYSVIKHKF